VRAARLHEETVYSVMVRSKTGSSVGLCRPRNDRQVGTRGSGKAVGSIAPPTPAARSSGNRWTSVLALQRATDVHELFLEAAPEWRHYEDVRAQGVAVTVKAGALRCLRPGDPPGYAQLVMPDGSWEEYHGPDGWVTGKG